MSWIELTPLLGDDLPNLSEVWIDSSKIASMARNTEGFTHIQIVGVEPQSSVCVMEHPDVILDKMKWHEFRRENG